MPQRSNDISNLNAFSFLLHQLVKTTPHAEQ
jgi:hypothetical protein